jgi:pyroglutamyl-peptidase
MRLLLTGFEPFGGSRINPSEQVVRALAQEPPPGIELITAILSVDHQCGPLELLRACEQASPEAVLCLGEAPQRSAISIERLAINLLDFRIPDNQGIQVTDEPIIPGGPAAYFTTLPVKAIWQAIQNVDIPAELSLSAGAYLCNQVLYRLLHHLAQNQLHIPAGFIHLPRLPEQVSQQNISGPSMSLEISARGIKAAIGTIKQADQTTRRE